MLAKLELVGKRNNEETVFLVQRKEDIESLRVKKKIDAEARKKADEKAKMEAEAERKLKAEAKLKV